MTKNIENSYLNILKLRIFGAFKTQTVQHIQINKCNAPY